MPIAVCKLFALPSLWAAAPPWRSAAPPPDRRIIPPAHRMRSQSASLAGARSAFTARPASGGCEQDGRRKPWREQTQDPGGFRAAAQGLATDPIGASAPDTKGRRAWPRPLARRGPWRGLRQRRRSKAQRERWSEHPERLRSALHLELHRPLLGRGNRHQAARAHGKGSGIKEPDPCPGRIKTGRVVLDANRADRGRGGDGRICRGQPNQAPIRGNPRQALEQAHHHHLITRWAPRGTHQGKPHKGTNTAEDSAPAAAIAARSSSTWASCSACTSLSC